MSSVTDSINPNTLIVLAITLLVLVIFTLLKISQNMRILKSRRSDQQQRIRKLTLSRMLEYLNIPFKYYASHTSELDKERHMWACKNCPHPKQCQQLLEGKRNDVEKICPNYSRLKPLQDKSQIQQGHNSSEQK